MNQIVVCNEETSMNFNNRAADNKVMAGPAKISAPATAAVARPSHPERRDWRKRRKVRARRTAGLRCA
jgi:hypothetical protein